MKILRTLLFLVASMFCLAGYSQTNAPAPVVATNSPGLQTLVESVKTSGFLSASNYAPQLYVTYFMNPRKGLDRVGGGVLVPYNINKYLALGLGADYLGHFSMISANLTFQVPFAFTLFGRSFIVSPFVVAGGGEPLSGSSQAVAVIEDAGAYLKFGHLWGGQFDIGGSYGAWQNAGDYSGQRAHAFVGWSLPF